jgi:hypothetical protein
VTPVATFMPAPTNLAFGADQATCDKARAGLPGTGTPQDLCQILPHQGAGIFYWDWKGNAAHPVAVGFRVYRTDGGHHDLIRETHVASPPIEGDTALASGGLVNNACYSVTAWDQTAESAATPPLCISEKPFVVPPALSRTPIPAPGPPVMGPGVPMAAGRLPAPSQLLGFKHPAEATDPRDRQPTPCNVHGGIAGGLACQALLPKGGLALVWSYGPAHVDGFRVYSVPRSMARPPGRPEPAAVAVAPGPAINAPIATQATRLEGGQVATLVVLDPRPAGFGNECFAVTAFAGAEESEKSAPFCAAP